jgi:serine/threonine-protein kinase
LATVPPDLSSALQDRYRIERELGQGGMATVYLAHDLKHDRKVAIKVLRPELAAVIGAERFLAEIKMTAALQHPHILPLFDSGAAGQGGGGAERQSFLYYVMPYVQGESLRDRLNREKQLPIADAVRLASEVAGAVDYAHRHGVIHRDLKPENILLHDGQALVADFGIALAVTAAGGTRLTETGLSLGTPYYMSPEQAMGEREITGRSDVFALGVVTYEMLLGEPPFTGPTSQAVVARVMNTPPASLIAQRGRIPAHVEEAVLTALEKLPADRWGTAAEYAEALAGGRVGQGGRGGTKAAASAPIAFPASTAQQRLWHGTPWALAAAALGIAAWLVTHRPEAVPPPTARFTMSFGRNAAPTGGPGSPIAFSPDGSRIVYVGVDSAGGQQLYLRSLDAVNPVPIPGTAGAEQPFFSPDGKWLGFRQDDELRKLALAGGAAITICHADGRFLGASWGAGDVILFSLDGRLLQVSAAGGEPTDIAVPDPARGDAYRTPELLPDAHAAVFTAMTDSGPGLRAVTLADGVVRPLGQRGMSPHYVSGGYLAYVESDGTLFAAPFDALQLRITGTPQPIADNLRLGPQAAKLGLALTGSLAYLGGSVRQLELALVDRDGQASVLPAGVNWYNAPRFSPDGRRIAVTINMLGAQGFTPGDIWVWDLAAHNFQRITFDTLSATAEWAPDGRRLIYTHESGAGTAVLYTIPANGSGQPELLLTRPGFLVESAPTPDGRSVVIRESSRTTGRGIWLVSVDSPQAARPLVVTPFEALNPALSPDGRWLAYTSNETGTLEIYVRGLAEGAGRTRVSTGGGFEPRWARSGRELFFLSRDSLYAAAISPEPEFRASAAHALFAGHFLPNRTTNWDVAPDGRRFVMVRPPAATAESSSLNVVLNWFDQPRAWGR